MDETAYFSKESNEACMDLRCCQLEEALHLAIAKEERVLDRWRYLLNPVICSRLRVT
jgi:hypothetical protein